MGGLLRLLSFVIFVWMLSSGIRRLFLLLSVPQPGKGKVRQQEGVLLVQDPQCGRFVSERDAITGVFHGQGVHFCSQECLDHYTHAQIKR